MNETQSVMSPVEKRAAFSLAGIYSLRMLGLFMILPVLALYAEHFEDSTPFLIGLAIGIYGLSQALLQIPFGLVSDRIGRKPVIIVGLLIFALGSVVAAMSDTIYGVIAGRALQGSGAIAAAVMALAADLTREEHRLKVMAIIGMSIGVAFAVAMVLGSLLHVWVGVDGLFWITAVLAIAGIGVVKYWVPNAVNQRLHRDTQAVPQQFKQVLHDGQLLRLDFGIFTLHMVLSATFVALPLAMASPELANFAAEKHWMVYLPVMLLSMALMVPFIIIAESKRRMKQVFVAAILTLIAAELAMWGLHDSLWGIIVSLLVFFIAFNVLEASLPSLVAKMSPTEFKGTAMGVYSSSQFLGAFLGGALGGKLMGEWGLGSVFLFSAAMLFIWWLLAYTMKHPRYLSSFVVHVGPQSEAEAKRIAMHITEVQGVAEATVLPDEGMAYLKVELHALDREALSQFAVEK